MSRSAPEIRSVGLASRLTSLATFGVCLFLAAGDQCCAQESPVGQIVDLEVIFPSEALTWPRTGNSIGVPLATVPEPWWTGPLMESIRPDAQPLPIDLDTLFALTATHSGRVQAIAQTPWVNQMRLEQAQAAFDPTLYSDNRFDSTSDPVENTLTTGGPPRLEDNLLGLDTGLRGQNRRGTNYRVGQRFGHKNSNSNFFAPNDQGTSRLGCHDDAAIAAQAQDRRQSQSRADGTFRNDGSQSGVLRHAAKTTLPSRRYLLVALHRTAHHYCNADGISTERTKSQNCYMLAKDMTRRTARCCVPERRLLIGRPT